MKPDPSPNTNPNPDPTCLLTPTRHRPWYCRFCLRTRPNNAEPSLIRHRDNTVGFSYRDLSAAFVARRDELIGDRVSHRRCTLHPTLVDCSGVATARLCIPRRWRRQGCCFAQ